MQVHASDLPKSRIASALSSLIGYRIQDLNSVLRIISITIIIIPTSTIWDSLTVYLVRHHLKRRKRCTDIMESNDEDCQNLGNTVIWKL